MISRSPCLVDRRCALQQIWSCDAQVPHDALHRALCGAKSSAAMQACGTAPKPTSDPKPGTGNLSMRDGLSCRAALVNPVRSPPRIMPNTGRWPGTLSCANPGHSGVTCGEEEALLQRCDVNDTKLRAGPCHNAHLPGIMYSPPGSAFVFCGCIR